MIDKKFLKDWGLSLLTDVSFIFYIVIAYILNAVIIGSTGIAKFIANNSVDDVLANPAMLPSKSVLYFGFAITVLTPILFMILGYFVFVLTRHLFYRRTIKGFWKSTWKMFAGIFILFIPLYFVVIVAALLGSFLSFGSIIVSQMITTFIVAIFLSLNGYYFIRAKTKTPLQAAGDAYELIFKNPKQILIGAGVVTGASLVFMLFGTYVLSTRYLYQGLNSWWYILTTLLIISWLRVYIVGISKESVVEKVVEKTKNVVKTTVKKVKTKATKVKKSVKKATTTKKKKVSKK